MDSDKIEPPEWHFQFLREREEALKNGTDHFIEFEEFKRQVDEKIEAAKGIRRGMADLKAGRTTSSAEFFEDFFSRHNIIDNE